MKRKTDNKTSKHTTLQATEQTEDKDKQKKTLKLKTHMVAGYDYCIISPLLIVQVYL